MARTSRRKGLGNVKEVRNVALYARISVDDKSDTIENQLEILRAYASDNKFNVYKEYVDIGKTGTNFAREGFKELLKDVHDKKIQVIVVKDLSRLGRNYLETGEYIEKVFPLYGVRFIAIVDKYDSDLELGNSQSSNSLFDYAIKNLVNEMYSVDISRKVRSSIRMKQIGNKPYGASIIPYGYKKSESKEYIYEIDSNVSWIVEEIYSMYKKNVSITDITLWLCKMKINSPNVYRKMGKVYSDGDYTNWNKSTVYRILNNKIYYGILEVNKTTSDFYNERKISKTKHNDRFYFENAVEALIKI